MSGSGKGKRAAKRGADGRARSFQVSGELLCSLRTTRGWTQLNAAERGGISERLLRKAEAGGKLGLRSIAILARLYSTDDAPLSADDILVRQLADSPGVAGQMADVEAIVRRWHDELWNQHRLETIAELAAPDCVLHVSGKRLRGQAAVRRYVESIHAALSDFQIVVKEVVVYGDLAVAKWRLRFDHADARFRMAAHAKDHMTDGSTWIRVADGRLCEAWKYWDFTPP